MTQRKPMTQTQRVLALLRKRQNRGLTASGAYAEIGTMRLAARIADLRAAGHDIRSETIRTLSGARVARYTLHEQPEQLTWQ